MQTKISIINKRDFKSISKIWTLSLPNDFFSTLGIKYIYTNYFNYFNKLENKIGFKIIVKKKTIGFVIYGRYDLLIASILKNNFSGLILYSLKSIFINIKAIPKYINIIIFMLLSRKFKYLNKHRTELLVFAIHPKYHRMKLGTKLLKKSLLIIKKKKFAKEVYVKTQLQNPKFYKTSKFKLINKIFGRNILKYKV